MRSPHGLTRHLKHKYRGTLKQHTQKKEKNTWTDAASICIYTHIHTYKHTCITQCMHAYKHTHTHTHMHAYPHTYMHTTRPLAWIHVYFRTIKLYLLLFFYAKRSMTWLWLTRLSWSLSRAKMGIVRGSWRMWVMDGTLLDLVPCKLTECHLIGASLFGSFCHKNLLWFQLNLVMTCQAREADFG